MIKIFSRKKDSKSISTKGKIMTFFSKLAKSFMLPIAILPVAGIMLGIGATVEAHSADGWKTFGHVLSQMGDLVFSNLPFLFAISLAIGFSNMSGVAALAAGLGFLVFNLFISVFLKAHMITQHLYSYDTGQVYGAGTTLANKHILVFTYSNAAPSDAWKLVTNKSGIISEYSKIKSLNLHGGTNTVQDSWNLWFWKDISLKSVRPQLGIKTLNTGVVGGVAVGLMAAWAYNRFHKTRLPKVLGFFAADRSVAIVMFGFSMLLSVFFILVWPLLGLGLNKMGLYTSKAPAGLDSFFEGMGARALLPFGLHHAFYGTLWWTSAGGSLINFQGTIVINHSIDLLHATNGGGVKETIVKLNKIDHSQNGVPLFAALKVALSTHQEVLDKTQIWFNSINSSTWLTEGDQKIQQAVFADPTLKIQDVWAAGLHTGRYITGGFPLFMFGLPGIALGMWTTIPKQYRKQAMGIYGSAAATALLTGVTEPIEFTFLFVSPLLYFVVYVPLAGLSWMLMNILHVSISVTFSQGLFDFIIYGVLPSFNGHQTNWWIILLVGPALGLAGFLLFRYIIIWRNIPIPGRQGDNFTLITKNDFNKSKQSSGNEKKLALKIINAYGGKSNILSIDACATRLRIDVKNLELINEQELKNTGAIGVIKAGMNVQAVYGTHVSMIKNNVQDVFNEKNINEVQNEENA